MSKKLYVGNIPYTFTEKDLTEIFSAAGTVTSARIITDRFTGRGKGFGFVEMSSDEEGFNAINTVNGTQVGGRSIVVSEARIRKDNEHGERGDRSDRPPRTFNKRR